MDPKVTVGRVRSGWTDVICVTCDRYIHIYEGPTGEDDHYRCGYCSGERHACRVAEFVLEMPKAVHIYPQVPGVPDIDG